MEIVSPKLRKDIISGKDIKLAALLLPLYSGSAVVNETKDDNKDQKFDQRLHRDLSIGEFIHAFGIYKSIMCEAFPYRRQELDLYERDIVDMATRYNGKGFYQYHKQFSAKAYAYLKYQNIPVDRSVRNNTLFCNIFANLNPMVCSVCSSTNHTTPFCPHTSPMDRSNAINANRGSISSYVDIRGRPKKYFQGREICNNFNSEKGCSRVRCNLHVCFQCHKEHSVLKCQGQKTVCF